MRRFVGDAQLDGVIPQGDTVKGIGAGRSVDQNALNHITVAVQQGGVEGYTARLSDGRAVHIAVGQTVGIVEHRAADGGQVDPYRLGAEILAAARIGHNKADDTVR